MRPDFTPKPFEFTPNPAGIYPKNPARIYIKLGRNLPRIRPEFTPNPAGIHLKSGRNFPKSGQNSPKVRLEFSQNPAGIHPTSSRNLPKIFLEFSKNLPEFI